MSGPDQLDDLQLGGWKIWQNEDYFRFGTDGVLLADFAECKRKNRVIDLCSGTGIVPFLLLAHEKAEKVEAVEIQPYLCRLMEKSIEENQCPDRMKVWEGDLKEIQSFCPKRAYDLVTVNPPYEPLRRGLVGENPHKNIARREECCNLEEVLQAAEYLLGDGGRFCMVHRPYRMAECLLAMERHNLRPSRLKLVEPRQGEKPILFLVEGVRGKERELTIEPTLILHQEDGSMSEELKKIYRR